MATIGPAARGTPGYAIGLPLGTPAPGFSLVSIPSGATIGLDGLREARLPVLLVFTSPACGRCHRLERRLTAWQAQHRHALALAIISCGTLEANRAFVARTGLSNVLLQETREVARAYRVGRMPSAVLVAVDGTIATAVASDEASIGALLGIGGQALLQD